MEELKKCPFCGGNARVSVRQKLFIGWVGEFENKKINYAAQVICNKCHARGGIITGIFVSDSQLKHDLEWLGERAIESWNRREGE